MTDRPCANGCGREAAHDRKLCGSCRWAKRQQRNVDMRMTRMSERRAPDGTVLGTNVTFVPAPEAAEAPLRPAAPVNVTVNVGRDMCGDLDLVRNEVALILPDPQIGFRQTRDGVESFHDDDALAVAVQLAADLRPNYVVHLGDFLDFAPFSRFAQEPGFRGMTQRSIDRGHEFLAVLAEVTGAPQYILEGNHDVRIARTLAKLAPEAAMLRPAGDDGWPMMSVPRLLRLEELNVTYVDGYPANELWLGDRLRCEHGSKVSSAGSTAALLSKTVPASTLFGHVHRQELHWRTDREGRAIFACSPGTLAKTTGSVPSFHSSVSGLTERSLYRHEDWQQGLAVVSWREDDDPELELVRITEGVGIFRGTRYEAGS